MISTPEFDPSDYQARTLPAEDGEVSDYDVTVGLLCYRDRENIDNLLASLAAHPKKYKYEIILSDNGSSDGTREMIQEKYPYVRVLENKANLGVAAGRNRIFWNSRAKYTMILDSDTLLHANTIDRLVETAEAKPEAGIVHPQLLYRDGSLQLSIRPFPRLHHILIEGTKLRALFEWTGIPSRVQMRDCGHDSLMPFDCCYGAAMLIRNSAIRQTGGFDEGYFYQYEDYDLCYRIKAAGHENWYQPEAQVTHFYSREDQFFHPGIKAHLRSIFRFLTRNIWQVSKAPILHRTDFDKAILPHFSAPVKLQ